MTDGVPRVLIYIMNLDAYQLLKRKALQLAASLGTPAFYRVFEDDLRLSGLLLQENEMLKMCRRYIDPVQEGMGHGFEHSKAVAVDAGAIVLIEGKRMALPEGVLKELIASAHVSGLLHDIKRGVEDHAVAGSRETERILDRCGIVGRCKRYIALAIRNHEAFKEEVDAEDEYGRLVSDALYDADKFRWGPENFTTTIWRMLEFGKVSPLGFLENYKRGISYIERIKGTFRTETGRLYGPEIIDMGLEIGMGIYPELKRIAGVRN